VPFYVSTIFGKEVEYIFLVIKEFNNLIYYMHRK